MLGYPIKETKRGKFSKEIPDLLERVDFLRLDACRKLKESRKAEMGQFLTPSPVARLMASMMDYRSTEISILDPGAGVGSLFAACVAELCRRRRLPKVIRVTAYEIDEILAEYIPDTLKLCQKQCERLGIKFIGEVQRTDFIEAAAEMLVSDMISHNHPPRFNCVIMNPPYKKIHSGSKTRKLLQKIGIETGNLYTGFLFSAIQLLQSQGEMVAITPRSFCNGPYFKNFRESFLKEMALRRLHLFESRQLAFRDDEVLQENLIFHAIKDSYKPGKVKITSSIGPEDELISTHEVPYNQVVYPGDPQSFIHIVSDEIGQQIAERMTRLKTSLDNLGLSVSTGRVVDFRVKEFLQSIPGKDSVPLIYPTHINHGYVSWPKIKTRKPNAIVMSQETHELFIPNENYVLIKRFSSKEEKRRVVAAVHEGKRVTGSNVAFENHLNYIHQHGRGLAFTISKGLAAFLNSTLVDTYFRQFSGHTQVNASDLRNMKYPTLDQLKAIGSHIKDSFPEQDEIDKIVDKEVLNMAVGKGGGSESGRTTKIKKRIDEALEVLKTLGLPRAQQNERSALTLLALLDIKPDSPWSDASNPLCGITPMMDFFAEHYSKTYKPNTRETVRRQTVHQFLDAGLIVANPDKPERAINSPKAVYQIEGNALALLKTFETKKWDKNLRSYLTSVETLRRRYAQEREMKRIPIKIAPGKTITISPGGQNVLVKEIIEQFAPRFTPGGKLLYVGDTDIKFAHYDTDGLEALGVKIESHGKMPDVIIYYTEKDWIVLIEAVTSHGPVNPKRRGELKRLFQKARPGLIFVTAFMDRKSMVKYLNDISWETEVWVAESPTHLIHFNGERFLGPY